MKEDSTIIMDEIIKQLENQPIRYKNWLDKLLGLPDVSFTPFELRFMFDLEGLKRDVAKGLIETRR